MAKTKSASQSADVLRIECAEKTTIEKIAGRLRDPWSDFISSFEQCKPGQSGFSLHGLLVSGDKSGLKIVAQNISQANKEGYYRGGAAVSLGAEPSGDTARSEKSAKDGKSGTLRIWIPVLEEEWQPGILIFDVKAAKKAPPAVRKALRNGRLPGWQVVGTKTSIGLDFDLSQKGSRANLSRAVELGWTKWWIAWDLSRSNIRPDAVQTFDSSKAMGSEFRAMIGKQIVGRLEESGNVTFEEADGPDRPDDAVLYDCRDRCEPPWKMELLKGKSSKALYSFDRKGGPLPENELRDIFLRLAAD